MDISKSFCMHGRTIPFISIPSLLSHIKADSECLVITEKRILEQYAYELGKARIICRENYPKGPTTVSLIEQISSDAGADFKHVIGIGGGAILDIAKILSLQTIIPVATLFENEKAPQKARFLTLVPTTPGTGSEATPFAAVLFEKEQVQRILISDALSADEILLCPRFLKGIPFKVLAASSFVSFVHACEGFTSPLATAITRALAEKSLRILIKIWKQVAAHGIGSLENEYEHLQNAGNLAGIVCANAGGAAVPALAYPLCIRLGIPHGEACYQVFFKIFLTYIKKSHSHALEELVEILADALRCHKEEVFTKLQTLCDAIIEHKKLREYGMKEDNILEYTDLVLTRQHMLISNSNDQLTVSEIAKIYKDLL
ncbi:MAG: iron-containing alcohol dehydrogenase [Succinatimonas sp.]|nr:iron-containing alcohol dehydrogenase [Succinatimonas sp.]